MFRALSNFISRSKSRSSQRGESRPALRRRPRSRRLLIEALETRLAPAIVHVTTLSDAEFHSGVSLRDAVDIANATPNSTILFDVTGQISLTQHELMLNANMTIDGGTRGRIQISGLREDRVFDVEKMAGNISGHHVDLLHLIIKDGQPRAGSNFHNGNGGGIYVNYPEASLTLFDDLVTLNSAQGSGGGVYSNGPVTLVHTTVENNTAVVDGGGVWAGKDLTVIQGSLVTDNTAGRNGGGLYENGTGTTVTVTDSEVRNNRATNGQGGGIWAQFNVILTRSYLHNNTARQDGGGIYSEDGNVTVTDHSRVNSNTSIFGNGGGIWADSNVTVSNVSNVNNVLAENSSLVSLNFANHNGGGIFMTRFHSLVVSLSTIFFNQAGNDGGGVFAEKGETSEDSESITIVDSTFDSNSAGMNGGGLRTQDVENVSITFSCFSNNTAQSGTGGAVDSEGSNVNVYIVNSTFGANSARLARGAIYVKDQGLLLTANHVSFNDNVSYGGDQSGSAIFVDNGATGYLENTLVDDTNNLSFLLNTDLLSHSGGSLISLGHNLVVDHSFTHVTGFDATIGDSGGISQGLDPLANYGGNTFTYRLQAGPAVGGADNTGPYEDQRHRPRTFGSMDIGSYQTPLFIIAVALPLH
jgi:predicted outer membrane repeat protein